MEDMRAGLDDVGRRQLGNFAEAGASRGRRWQGMDYTVGNEPCGRR